jgi:hypothetical protein
LDDHDVHGHGVHGHDVDGRGVDGQGVDGQGELAALLHDFVEDLKLAVPSYRGMSIRFDVTDHEVALSLLESGTGDIATSMLLPLSAVASQHGAGVLMVYASTPGAFVDLAADLSFALRLAPDALMLDQHLENVPASSRIDGLNEYSTINQAIGVLIDQGHTVASAGSELRRQAVHQGVAVHAAAATVLRLI